MSKVVTPREVLSVYRHLLRSIAITFKGDNRVIVAAKTTARTKFDEGKKWDPASDEALKGLEEARGASTFLRQAVIQGVKDDDSANFRLRIHEDIALGDNESIKNPPPMPKIVRKYRSVKRDSAA